MFAPILIISKQFIIETSIYVDENEFNKIKNIDKELNENLKKLINYH